MITIRTCVSDTDIQALAKTAKMIWNEYFIDLITQEQIDYMVDRFQSYPALRKAIQEDGYIYYLAYDNEELIGYCGVQPQENRLFLSKLYVLKSYRGQGISSSLFQCALKQAQAQKLSAIYLTCNKYNTHSLDIYVHKGFRQIDAVQSDIGHGFIMDDYILQYDL